MGKWKLSLKKLPRSRRFLKINEDDFKEMYIGRCASDFFGSASLGFLAFLVAETTGSVMFAVLSSLMFIIATMFIVKVLLFDTTGHKPKDILDRREYQQYLKTRR